MKTERQKLDDVLHTRGELPFLRTPYNYDRDAASNESGLKCADASRTKQAPAEEVDINQIVARFIKTGQMPTDLRTPLNGDFTNLPDYQTALNMVREGQEAFNAMPVEVRTRFHNDPAEFIDFISNDDNRAEAEKWGLALPRKAAGAVDAETGEILPGDPAKPKDTPSTPPKGGKADK